MSRSHPCPEESSVMHSKPLAPRPSGAAHPSASHPAASDPVASRPSASDPPASDPPASDPPASVPASPGGSAAAAAPARGRHDRGALAVLVLSLLQVTVEPLPDAVHAMIGSPEMAGYLLVQGLSLVSVLLTFALWAAVIWWLARSRHGDTLGLARSEERRGGKESSRHREGHGAIKPSSRSTRTREEARTRAAARSGSRAGSAS